MTPPRIPGKRVVYFKGRPVVMTDADYRAFVGALEKKPRGKKRAK